MTEAFLAGALAGYAIAIPVGAIAVLIVETAMRRGFRVGAGAGLGAATADGIFAALAAIGGLALAGLIEPVERPLRLVGVGVLVGIGLRGLIGLVRRGVTTSATDDAAGPAAGATGSTAGASGAAGPVATWLRFTGLTLLNPTTILYFAALILGLGAFGEGPWTRMAFVSGAFLASASWQLILAAVGAVAHHHLGERFRFWFGLAGNLVIVGFGVGLLLGLR